MRVRYHAQEAAGGGHQCTGGNRERRSCGQAPCPAFRERTTSTSTTTTTTTTTTRRTTTTRAPAPVSRVTCHVCGSLFDTEAPDCPRFDAAAAGQRRTCGEGEACLYYSWQKAEDDFGEVVLVQQCLCTLHRASNEG